MPSPRPPWRIKAVQCLLAGVILAVGILLAWAGYFHQWKKVEKGALWVKTPCQITSWNVHVSRGVYGGQASPSIGYQYHFNGKSYHSLNHDKFSDLSVDLRDYEAEGDVARRGPTFCYVNPERPSEASFRPVQVWLPYGLMGGGLMLAVVGVSIMVFTFIPASPFTDNLGGRFMIGLVSLGFLGFGFHQLWEMGTSDKIMGLIVDSRLIEVPAQVKGTCISKVQGKGKSRHRTYNKSHIVYSYEFGGRRWHADRWYYDLTQLDVGSEEDSRAMLAKYPAGLETSCWILPDKPWCATLQRRLHWGYLWLIMPLLVIAGGLRLAIAFLRGR